MKAPRRRVGRAERERQILDAAVAVFSERGYLGTSMDAVAERVGVTKPVLYTHFGSKDGLLLACIARARAELLEAVVAAAAAADGPEETMRRATRAFFDFLDAQGPAWLLLYSEPNVAGDALEGIRAQQTDFVIGLLRDQAPRATGEQLEAWAHMIVACCEQLALWRARSGTERISSARAAEYVMDLVWTGLAQQT